MTEKRKHTPGPWRIGDAKATIFGPPNGKPSPQTIAHLGVMDHEANGALIAAAPELLTFAKATEAFLTNMDVDASSYDIRSRGQVYAEMLRAAIAKAEGGK